jgi:hypothetical protein
VTPSHLCLRLTLRLTLRLSLRLTLLWMTTQTIGCDSRPTPLPEVVKILETVEQNPDQTKNLCDNLHPLNTKMECILIGAHALSKNEPLKAKELCSLLTSTTRGECWFRLAERTDDPTLCTEAVPFVKDCHLHLLSRWMFRHPNSTWENLNSKAIHYAVDPKSKEGETVLYRHMLSTKNPMQLDACMSKPNPTACRLAGKGIYRDRLRYAEHNNTFPCTLPNEHALHHTDTPSLYPIYEEFYRAICSTQ